MDRSSDHLSVKRTTDPVCVFHFFPSALSGVACLNILRSADRPRLWQASGVRNQQLVKSRALSFCLFRLASNFCLTARWTKSSSCASLGIIDSIFNSFIKGANLSTRISINLLSSSNFIFFLLPLWGGVSEHQYCTLISTRCQVELQRFYKFISTDLHDATPAPTRIRSTESQHRSRRSARPRIICEIMRAPSATIRKRPATIACGAFFGVGWYVESCRKAMRQNRS